MRLFTVALSLFLLLSAAASAQSTTDLLNLLAKKGTITQAEADSIKAEYSQKQKRSEESLDSFPLKLGRSLDLSGYTQVLYQNYQQAGKTNGVTIKRARLDFQATGFNCLLGISGKPMVVSQIVV